MNTPRNGFVYNLKMVSALLAILLALEIFAELAIVGTYFAAGKNYTAVARTLVGTNLLFSGFLPKSELSKATGVVDIGQYALSTANTFNPPDGFLGWRQGKSVGVENVLNEEQYLISEIAGKSVEEPWRQWVFTNDQGFYSSGDLKFHFDKPKPVGVFRVIVMGGSTVAGVPLGYKENIPAKLRIRLNEIFESLDNKTYSKVEVINAGVVGFFSSLEHLNLLSELVDFEPDIVIQYDGWNDSTFLNRIAEADPDRATTKFLFRTPAHKINDARLNSSYELAGSFLQFAGILVDRVKVNAKRIAPGFVVYKVFDWLEYRKTWSRYKTKDEAPEPADSYFPESNTVFEKNLEKNVFLARQYGFKILFLMQPLVGLDNKTPVGLEKMFLHRYKNFIDTARKFYDGARTSFATLERKYPSSEGICFADISGNSIAHIKNRAYIDRGHLSEEGNAAVADAMIRELNRCRFLPTE